MFFKFGSLLMIKLFQAAFLAAGFSLLGFSQFSLAFDLANSLPAGGELTYTTKGLKKNSMNYRVFLPDGYDKTQKYPVIMYLHSAAERDQQGKTDAIFGITNLNGDGKVADNPWLGALIKETQHGKHKAIVIVPSGGWFQYWCGLNNGDQWNLPDFSSAKAPAETDNEKLALGILDKVVKQYNGDTSKIILTGASMGGWGTWDLSWRHPDKFYKVVPLSGGGNSDPAGKIYKSNQVWAFHGKEDSLITPQHSEAIVNAILKAKKVVTFTEPEKIGHGGWDAFYTDGTYTNAQGESLYDWMLPIPENKKESTK